MTPPLNNPLEKRIRRIEEWIDLWETYDSGWNDYRKTSQAEKEGGEGQETELCECGVRGAKIYHVGCNRMDAIPCKTEAEECGGLIGTSDDVKARLGRAYCISHGQPMGECEECGKGEGGCNCGTMSMKQCPKHPVPPFEIAPELQKADKYQTIDPVSICDEGAEKKRAEINFQVEGTKVHIVYDLQTQEWEVKMDEEARRQEGVEIDEALKPRFHPWSGDGAFTRVCKPEVQDRIDAEERVFTHTGIRIMRSNDGALLFCDPGAVTGVRDSLQMEPKMLKYGEPSIAWKMLMEYIGNHQCAVPESSPLPHPVPSDDKSPSVARGEEKVNICTVVNCPTCRPQPVAVESKKAWEECGKGEGKNCSRSENCSCMKPVCKTKAKVHEECATCGNNITQCTAYRCCPHPNIDFSHYHKGMSAVTCSLCGGAVTNTTFEDTSRLMKGCDKLKSSAVVTMCDEEARRQEGVEIDEALKPQFPPYTTSYTSNVPTDGDEEFMQKAMRDSHLCSNCGVHGEHVCKPKAQEEIDEKFIAANERAERIKKALYEQDKSWCKRVGNAMVEYAMSAFPDIGAKEEKSDAEAINDGLDRQYGVRECKSGKILVEEPVPKPMTIRNLLENTPYKCPHCGIVSYPTDVAKPKDYYTKAEVDELLKRLV